MKLSIKSLNTKLLTGLLLSTVYLLATFQPVQADLTVVCPNSDLSAQKAQVICQLQAGERLFDDSTLLMPGITLKQNLVVQNQDQDEPCALTMAVTRTDLAEKLDLANILWLAIYDAAQTYFGQVEAGQATNLKTLHNLYQVGPLSLGTILPNSSQTFTWLATLDGETVGNEYQGKASNFDLALNFVCGVEPTSAPDSPTGQVSGVSTSNSGPASPPVCSDSKPSQAPANLQITASGNNSVSLSWSAVSPVTHYALIFTRNDGEVYGANNIGNVTNYTINNLAPGFSYIFEVLAINGCQPGDRAQVSSAVIGGIAVVGRPVGPSGEVLGVTQGEKLQEVPSVEAEKLGEVAGLTTCVKTKYFLPWIILAIQVILIILFEYWQRKNRNWLKHLIVVAVTGLSILAFYLLKECNCYLNLSLLAWFCQWYWVAASVLTGLLRVIAYIFIEEL